MPEAGAPATEITPRDWPTLDKSAAIMPVYVIGHLNPDTDAIAAAMGHAWRPRERDGLEALRDLEGLELAVLMVTDVVGGSSRLVLAGEQAALADLPYKRLPDGTLDAPGVVSRKKQLLLAVLGQVN